MAFSIFRWRACQVLASLAARCKGAPTWMLAGLENDEYVRQIDGYLPTAERPLGSPLAHPGMCAKYFFTQVPAVHQGIPLRTNNVPHLKSTACCKGGRGTEAPIVGEYLPQCLICDTHTHAHHPEHTHAQVGASNELPESEELDALYDRFLLRRHVSRVTNANVHQLARLASGRGMTLDAEDEAKKAAAAAGEGLSLQDFKDSAKAAYEAVDVPDAVIDLLVELRNWLQVGCRRSCAEGWVGAHDVANAVMDLLVDLRSCLQGGSANAHVQKYSLTCGVIPGA
eukprot:1139151-Pelagomonas_calceolata.AAC.2